LAVISSSPQPHAASANARTRVRPRAWRVLLSVVLVLCDALALNGAFGAVYLLSIETLQQAGLRLPTNVFEIAPIVITFNGICMATFTFSGLYDLRRGSSRVDEVFKVFTAVSLATVLTVVSNSLLSRFGYIELPWTLTVLALSWLCAIIATVFLRFIYRAVVIRLRRYGIDTRRLVIVGARDSGRAVWATIRRRPELGYAVQGFLSDSAPIGSVVDGLPVLGHPSQIGRVIRATRADEVIIALSARSTQELLEVVTLAEDEAVAIKLYPDTFQMITSNELNIGDLSGLPLLSLRNAALDVPFNRALKRGLDIVVATFGLLVSAPLMILIALAIRVESKGPIFFLQERVGLDNKPFWVIKFRTMRPDAEALGTWTTPNDPRITRLGKLLRQTSLDELPQLINVLIGEMSVVGPRPEQPRWVEQFSQQIPRYMRRHKEKAGLTGWAQVNGLRGDTSIEERTRYDLYYIENWSLLFDIKIILRTAANLLTGKQDNAY
jgi:Undecaprenyl-phosphate glucose phosphotransferase